MTNSPPFPEKFYNDPMGLDRYVVQEKVLFEWSAPSKLSRKRSRAELSQFALIFIIIAAILVLSHEIFLTVVFGVCIALYFLYEASPPIQIRCQITTIGIKVEEKYYYWPQLSQFWFEEKRGTPFLHLRSIFPNVQIMKLIIRAEDEEKIKTTLGTYVLYKKPQESYSEKMLKQVTKYLPLDIDLW